MADKRGGKKKISVPPDMSAGLKMQRDTFVHTFFKKGAEFTEELLRENERLRKHAIELESDNARLRTQLASDEAIRELLRTVDQLEKEKQQLLSHVHEAEANSTRYSSRHQEMEEELSNLANLYIASYQLHSTLRLGTVVKHLRELLAQLVGARSHAYYVANPERTELVPIASDGVSLSQLSRVVVGAHSEPVARAAGIARIAERVFLTGVPHIAERGRDDASTARDEPAACVPMRMDDVVIGVIVVFSLLEQKQHFVQVDYEFFKMLGAHAATALVGALLFANAEGKLPSLEALHNLGT